VTALRKAAVCKALCENNLSNFAEPCAERGQPISESAPEHTRCPAHPDVLPEMGFGLAGGGYGPYSYCPVCSRIIHKTQEQS
jgi:hypothetical protein